MKPVAVLILLPLLVGVTAAFCFRDTRSASLAAALASVLVVCLSVNLLGGADTWGWLAALMVSPLTIACTVAAVLICHGRLRDHGERHHRHGT